MRPRPLPVELPLLESIQRRNIRNGIQRVIDARCTGADGGPPEILPIWAQRPVHLIEPVQARNKLVSLPSPVSSKDPFADFQLSNQRNRFAMRI